MQCKLAIITLEQRTKQRRDNQRLGQQCLDRGRITMRGKDSVERIGQPHQSPARIELGDGERERGVGRAHNFPMAQSKIDFCA